MSGQVNWHSVAATAGAGIAAGAVGALIGGADGSVVIGLAASGMTVGSATAISGLCHLQRSKQQREQQNTEND